MQILNPRTIFQSRGFFILGQFFSCWYVYQTGTHTHLSNDITHGMRLTNVAFGDTFNRFTHCKAIMQLRRNITGKERNFEDLSETKVQQKNTHIHNPIYLQSLSFLEYKMFHLWIAINNITFKLFTINTRHKKILVRWSNFRRVRRTRQQFHI